MKRLTLVIAMLFLLGAHSVGAQGTPSPTCPIDGVVAEANQAKNTGDIQADISALLKLAQDIENVNTDCNGMSFSSNAGQVVGPLDLPKGTYKATLTTTNTIVAQLHVLSGDCAASNNPTTLFSVINETGVKRSDEALLQSNGCRVLIQTSFVTAPWTLTIETVH